MSALALPLFDDELTEAGMVPVGVPTANVAEPYAAGAHTSQPPQLRMVAGGALATSNDETCADSDEAPASDGVPPGSGDNTGRPKSTALSLRRHQTKAVNAVVEAVSKKNPSRAKKVLVVHPTGTGKTVVMSELARVCTFNNRHVLWLVPPGAPVSELIEQAQGSLERMGRNPIVEQAERDGLPMFAERVRTASGHNGRGIILLASAKTLRGERLQRWISLLDNPLIIVDEAHHAVCDTCLDIFAAFPKSVIVGFTATPKRSDKRKLSEVFEMVADEYTLEEALREGRLVRPLMCPIRPNPPIDLSKIRITADGDFDEAELETVILDNMERLVSEAKPALAGRRTIAFTPNIKSAHALADALCQIGVRARYIASADINGKPIGRQQRKDILDAFEAGEFDVLTNPLLLSEGFDKTFIDCVAIFRPTRAENRYIQMVGRGLRLHPGKDHCMIVDFACDGHNMTVDITDLFADSHRSPEVIQRAKELVAKGEQKDVLKAVEQAEEEHLVDLTRKLQIRERQATARRLVYNPLDTLELIGWKPNTKEREWVQYKPAEDRDKAYLRKMLTDSRGRELVNVDELSFYGAKDLKRRLIKRREEGLCSVKQMRMLIARGLDPLNAAAVKFSEVNSVVAALDARRGYDSGQGGNWSR